MNYYDTLIEARSRLARIPATIYTSQYGDIQYRVAGSGPSVLVSHGITGGVDQAEYLVTTGFRARGSSSTSAGEERTTKPSCRRRNRQPVRSSGGRVEATAGLGWAA